MKHKVTFQKSLHDGSNEKYAPIRMRISSKHVVIQCKGMKPINRPYGFKGVWDVKHLIIELCCDKYQVDALAKLQKLQKTLKSMGKSGKRYFACQAKIAGKFLHVQVKSDCLLHVNRDYGAAFNLPLNDRATFNFQSFWDQII